jgi:glycerophosphoryl diester phosphodiesterase
MNPQVIAHRGASSTHPENTIAAFAGAVALGADGVELDVHASADGALVVHHDPNLADGVVIADLHSDALPTDVPLLPAALAACGDLLVNVEIKAAPVAPVVEAIEAWGGRVLVSSFDHRIVDAVRAAAPQVPTAQLTFLLATTPAETIAWIAARGHQAWHPHHRTIDPEVVAAAHAAGLVVNTWTVDDPERIAELAAADVDGIVTNDVATARRALRAG